MFFKYVMYFKSIQAYQRLIFHIIVVSLDWYDLQYLQRMTYNGLIARSSNETKSDEYGGWAMTLASCFIELFWKHLKVY